MKPPKLKIVFFDLEILSDADALHDVLFRVGDWPGRTLKATINSVICFGYRIAEEPGRPRCISAWDFPKLWRKNVNDDSAVCRAAYEVLRDADVIVTQNGKSFDWKFLQTRLLKHGLPVLPKILHLDTKLIAKANLFLFSNSLDAMTEFFEVKERKLDVKKEKGLWRRVSHREPRAQNLMAKYCKQDVAALEALFEKFRPFVKLPNPRVIEGKSGGCPHCGGTRLHRRGRACTATGITIRMQCQECGKWSHRAGETGKLRSL